MTTICYICFVRSSQLASDSRPHTLATTSKLSLYAPLLKKIRQIKAVQDSAISKYFVLNISFSSTILRQSGLNIDL